MNYNYLNYLKSGIESENVTSVLQEVKKYCLDLLQYYDIYFGKKKVKVNELTLDVLYGNGILETEEYLLKIIRFSPEIFICVGAIASLKDWGYSPAGVFKMINLFLDSDRI